MFVGICVYECEFKHVGKTLFVRIFLKHLCIVDMCEKERDKVSGKNEENRRCGEELWSSAKGRQLMIKKVVSSNPGTIY
jgi:hypothetical protein